MSIHEDPRFTIYFGDAQDQLYQTEYLQWHTADLLQYPSVQRMRHIIAVDQLIFLRQVHGSKGFLVTSSNAGMVAPFLSEGDFLITQTPHLGIGVMTADCLPVICYDQRQHLVGIAHVGWRGALQGVLLAMIQMMCTKGGTEIKDTLFWFGPSAKRCCYRVSEVFLRQLEPYPFAHCVWEQRGDAIYFDLTAFVQQQLALCGVLDAQISMVYHACTICNQRFCSYRRATQRGDSSKEGRQMTVVAVK